MIGKSLEKPEKYFYAFMIMLFIVLIALQLLLTKDSYRSCWSLAERMEGIPWEEAVAEISPLSEKVEIRISLLSYFSFPQARIMVNGMTAASFQEKTVCLNLQHGDYLEIDATAYKCDLVFRIDQVIPKIAWPPSAYLVKTHGSIATIGRVIIR